MKIAAITFSIASFAALLFALLQNPSAAGQDAFEPSNVSPLSTSESSDIEEELPVQHVGSGKNQPL
jgi:hypothetical protein